MFGYFQDENNVYVVLELAQNGTLYNYLKNPKNKITEE